MRLLLSTATTLLLLGIYADAAPAQNLPVLSPGDRGPEVSFYQGETSQWLAFARPGFGTLDEDGVYGPRTEAATRELQSAAGINVDGIAGSNTWEALYGLLGSRASVVLRTSNVTPEWPIPVPQWFWSWARWYLDRGEFRDQPFRSAATRPAAAPTRIPDWAWRRMTAINGRPEERRAQGLVTDRLRAIFGATRVSFSHESRSSLDSNWMLMTGSFDAGNQSTSFGAWVRLVRGRWMPWELGRLGVRLNLTPGLVPCDLRPAFSEPSC